MDFAKLTAGAKLILIAACVAFLSFFMNWFDVGFAIRNGFSTGTISFIAFYLYPVVALLTGKKVNRILGAACGILAIAATVVYISSNTLVLYDTPLSLTGTGVWVFMLTAAVMTAASVMGAGLGAEGAASAMASIPVNPNAGGAGR